MKKLKQKRMRKIAVMAIVILTMITGYTFATSPKIGVAAAATQAMVIGGITLTPEQEKYYNALENSFKSIIDKNEKGYITAAEAKKQMSEELKSYIEKYKLPDDIKDIGEFIESKMLELSKAVKTLQENHQIDAKTMTGIVKAAFKDPTTVSKLKNLKNAGGNVDVLEIKAVGNITTGSVTTDTGGNAILDLINTTDVNMKRLAETFIENFASVSNTSSSVVPYADYIPKEGDAAFAAEGGTAGQIDFKIEVRHATAKKAYAYEILTDESMEDIPRLQSFAQQILLQKTLLKRQSGILDGDGIGENPLGIMRIASAFDPDTWTGDKITHVNMLDCIRAAANQIYVTENFSDEIPYLPNVCYCNPSDWFSFIGRKDDKGMYIFNFQFNESNKVDTFIVIPKKNIPAGKILVGDFMKLNIVNYINYNVKVGVINEQLINGMQTIVGYNRFMTYVKEYDKRAFVYDTLANITDGIKAATL